MAGSNDTDSKRPASDDVANTHPNGNEIESSQQPAFTVVNTTTFHFSLRELDNPEFPSHTISDALYQRGGGTYRVTVEKLEPGCYNCERAGHEAQHCLGSREGCLMVCPFCDQYTIGNHMPEDCAKFDQGRVWDLFVVQRAGKCQYRTKSVKLSLGYLVEQRFREFPDEGPLDLYPHSWDFDRKSPYKANTHDYLREPADLISDPDTLTRDMIINNHRLFLPSEVLRRHHQPTIAYAWSSINI
ncbi:hypothetical protein QBC38DRAFT_503919 [Podospora fimiseda]|uniref:CCHC-type domain-containing protein n=1 Tax=Podospora fimiseda TaxID=252190 RepID=A0AAN6YPI5_9PEZI|nr:hypothetical protein QBC38DRAFT_503919 [Podospora fimiseda]